MNYSLPRPGSAHQSFDGLCRNCVAFAYGFSPNLFRRAEEKVQQDMANVGGEGIRNPVASNVQRLLALNSKTFFGETHTLEDIEAIYNANGLDAGNGATYYLTIFFSLIICDQLIIIVCFITVL